MIGRTFTKTKSSLSFPEASVVFFCGRVEARVERLRRGKDVIHSEASGSVELIAEIGIKTIFARQIWRAFSRGI